MGPMVDGLSEQDMRDLSVYLAGQPRAPHPAALAQSLGHARVTAQCGFCHGETGMGVMEGIPILGGQHRDYLEHALADYRSGVRSNETMGSIVHTLSEANIRDVTTYFAAQSSLETAQ